MCSWSYLPKPCSLCARGHGPFTHGHKARCPTAPGKHGHINGFLRMANDGVQKFSISQVVKKCGTSWNWNCFRSEPLEANMGITWRQQRGTPKEDKTKDSFNFYQNQASHKINMRVNKRRQQRRRYLDIHIYIQIDMYVCSCSCASLPFVDVKMPLHFVNNERNCKHVRPATQWADTCVVTWVYVYINTY